MAPRCGSVVTLKCEQCDGPFKYKLQRSNNRKHLCDACITMNNKQNLERFEEKRRNRVDNESQKAHRLLSSIPERVISPERLLNLVLRDTL